MTLPHVARDDSDRRHPVHVTLRIVDGMPSLRSPQLYSVVEDALRAGSRRFGFSLVHYSAQGNHLHLIAEAEDRRALSRGMQGLQIRLARRLALFLWLFACFFQCQICCSGIEAAGIQA